MINSIDPAALLITVIAVTVLCVIYSVTLLRLVWNAFTFMLRRAFPARTQR